MMEPLATIGLAPSRSPIGSDDWDPNTDPTIDGGALSGNRWMADLHGAGVALIEGRGAQGPLGEQFGHLPAQVGELVVVRDCWVARLREDQFLLIAGSPDHLHADLAPLAEASSKVAVTATDITHGRSILAVGGADVRNCLRKTTGLDLRERSFPDRTVAQTSLAKIRTTIVRFDLEGEPCFLFIVDRSLGQYLWDVLADTSGEGIWGSLDAVSLRERLFAV